MNINFNRFSEIFFSKEKFTSILTVRQAKVLAIALAAFAGLTAAYLLARSHFEKKVLQVQGPLVNGKLDGQGKQVFSDGTIWQGEFKDGLLHGKGEKIGSKQEERGHFDRGCLIKGTLQIGNERWKGSFRKGKLHGKGSFLVNSKEIMAGEFKSGKLHGMGKAIIRGISKEIVEEGEFLEGKLHGKGVRIYPSGAIWDSNFSQGVASGAGKIVYPGGSTEVGEFKDNCFFKGVFKNGKLTGLGKVMNGEGEIWEGNFEDGCLKKGKKILVDGTVWEGEFDHNPQLHLQSQWLCGQGKITFKDGKIYEGKFENSQLHGQGKITFKDGTIRTGEFRWGKLNGKGQEIDKNGQITKDGLFRDGFLIEGKMVHFVRGAVAEGLFEHRTYPEEVYLKGKLQYFTGEILEGEIIKGRLIGQGKRTLPNQCVFEGEFKDRNVLMEGKMTFPDGTIWEGEFDNHLLHGEGKIIFPDGRKWEGEFEHGTMIHGKKISKNGSTKNYLVNSASSPNT